MSWAIADIPPLPAASGGLLFFRGEGTAGCPGCAWSGVPTRIAGERSTVCPACEEAETHAYAITARCEDCRGVCVKQRMRNGRRWENVAQGELWNPRMPRREGVKVGRNEPCPCGSGRKAKKCCGVR